MVPEAHRLDFLALDQAGCSHAPEWPSSMIRGPIKSIVGQKQTLWGSTMDVRFTSLSRHPRPSVTWSALCHQRLTSPLNQPPPSLLGSPCNATRAGISVGAA